METVAEAENFQDPLASLVPDLQAGESWMEPVQVAPSSPESEMDKEETEVLDFVSSFAECKDSSITAEDTAFEPSPEDEPDDLELDPAARQPMEVDQEVEDVLNQEVDDEDVLKQEVDDEDVLKQEEEVADQEKWDGVVVQTLRRSARVGGLPGLGSVSVQLSCAELEGDSGYRGSIYVGGQRRSARFSSGVF